MRHQLPIKIGKGRSAPLSPELLINMFAEKAPGGAKSNAVCHGVPGSTLFSTISSSALIRGIYTSLANGTLYAVVGLTLYTIDSAGTPTSRGTIAGSGRVIFAESSVEICITTTSSKAYTYNSSEGLEEITSGDFPSASSVTYLDGYFIFTNRVAGSKDQFFISNLLDGEVYDALDFATAERYPDNLVRVFADHAQLLLFGTDSIEIWFNAGNADFPFARAQGSVIDDGLGAANTVEKVDESVIWLNHEGIVRRLEGNTPIRISDHAIEYLISKGDWANAYSWSYTMEGHQFYVLTVPASATLTQAGTYVWDAATRLWHQRKSYELDYSRLGFYARAFGKHIVGDSKTGLLYEYSLDEYQENGDHLISEMHFPQLQMDGKRFIVDEIQLDAEVGTGPAKTSSITVNTGDPFWSAVGNSLAVTGVADIAAMSETRIATVGDGANAELRVYDHDGTDFSLVGSAIGTGLDSGSLGGITAIDSSSVIVSGIFGGGFGFRIYSFDGSSWTLDSSDLNWYQEDIDLLESGRIVCVDREIGGVIDSYSYNGSGIFSFEAEGTTENSEGKSTITAMTSSRAAVFDSMTGGFGVKVYDSGASWSQTGNDYLIGSGTFYQRNGIDALSSSRIAIVNTNTGELQSLDFDGTDFSEAVGSLDISADSQSSLCAFSSSSVAVLLVDEASTLQRYTYGQASTTIPVALDDNPDIMLRVSSNTKTTGLKEPTRSMGKLGEYEKRIIWRRLGQHRSFTPIFRISSPVKRAAFAAYIKVRPCDS